MSLRLTNTLTGQKEEFQPLNPPRVTLYVCGVTVYDDCHVGHARGTVIFDVLRRYLESRYKYQVTHVRNITDVDDKIIDRARGELGSAQGLKAAAQAVAKRFEASFREDFKKLGLLSPTHEPKATEFIPKMIQFIGELIQKDMAYVGSDGVYFSVRKLSDYGQLSHQKIGQMREGVRGDPGEGKKDPLDFALWKKAKLDEPSWDSPWGPGRPGWHIECSTMSTDKLGDTFDIHGGGQDLIFPHHENELAQALGVGKKFARYWLHNGLLTVNGQKMSKSLGNIVRIGDALKRHPNPDVLRLFFLSAHYRSPMDFTWERLDEAARAYEHLTSFLEHVDALDVTREGLAYPSSENTNQATTQFFEAMDDDLNTPKALASLNSLLIWTELWDSMKYQDIKMRVLMEGSLRMARNKILELGGFLGFFQKEASLEDRDRVKKLVTELNEARRRGDFETSDAIRRQLIEQGYRVEDTPAGTVVRKRV